MRALRVVDEPALRAAIGYAEAIDALEAAFRAEDPTAGPARVHLDVPGGELLLMPAHAEVGLGVKLVTLTPANPAAGLPFIHGVYVLFAPGTAEPTLVVDGAALTGLRTAAVSALATRHLAREDARRIVVFGAGTQARTHAEAMAAVRPIEDVAIVGRDPDRAAALVSRLRVAGIPARTADADAVADADVICTCTTSAVPVVPSALVPAGAHVNAVGAYRADLRELDGALLARALIAVETRPSALEEAGDILLAIGEGAIGEGAIAGDLADVVCGRTRRASGDQVTVFKSVGVAFEDLVIAAALERGLRDA